MPERQRRKQPRPAVRPEPKSEPHHVADEPVAEAGSLDAGVKSPLTSTGLPVEEQVHKEWDPKKQGGLPIPLGRDAARTEVK